MLIEDNHPVLLLIDIQKGFDDPVWGNRNNRDAEMNVARLLNHWRLKNYPVIYVQHMSTSENSPLYPGKVGNDYKEEVKPRKNDPIFHKNVHSAFIGTDLEEFLRSNNYTTIVITGITTNYCVATTARMSGNLGFKTYVVSDGTACFDTKDYKGSVIPAETIQQVTLANLHSEFATIVSTDDILKG